MGKIKIPKNRDIEELVYQEENEIKTMQDVLAIMDSRQKFRERIKKEAEVTSKKLQNVYNRKDAQLAVEKRKVEYLKAISRLQEEEEK